MTDSQGLSPYSMCRANDRNLFYSIEIPLTNFSFIRGMVAQHLGKVKAKNRQILLLCLHSFLQCDGQLVGAAGGLATTADTTQTLDSLLCAHTLDELRNTLQIAVATAEEHDGLNDVALQLHINASRASTLGGISICHFRISLSFK